MIVIDNYLKDLDLLSKFECEDSWHTYDKQNNLNYDKETLFYNNNSVESIFEELIQYLTRDTYLNLSSYNYSKIEYWANHLSKSKPLDWHQDKDEVLLESVGETTHPLLGIIWYGKVVDLVGGYLEIDHNDFAGSYERIQPRDNRLIVFNPIKFHRVSKIFSGTRCGLQVNLW